MVTQVRTSEPDWLDPPEASGQTKDTGFSGLPLLSAVFLLYAAFDFGDFPSDTDTPGGADLKGGLPGTIRLLSRPTSGGIPPLAAFNRDTVGFVMIVFVTIPPEVNNDDDVGGIDDESANDVVIRDPAVAREATCPKTLFGSTLKDELDADTTAAVDRTATVWPEQDDCVFMLDFTTSCLESTLFGTLVRLIFIFKPLSTDDTCATLLLLMFACSCATGQQDTTWAPPTTFTSPSSRWCYKNVGWCNKNMA